MYVHVISRLPTEAGGEEEEYWGTREGEEIFNVASRQDYLANVGLLLADSYRINSRERLSNMMKGQQKL